MYLIETLNMLYTKTININYEIIINIDISLGVLEAFLDSNFYLV